MLKISDQYDPNIKHDFSLSNINFDNKWDFTLESLTTPGLPIVFSLPYTFTDYIDGYSTSIFLFRNQYLRPQDIIELRLDSVVQNHGRVGYFVKLKSIFEKGVLSIDAFIFSYLYYAAGNIFFNSDFKQTNIPSFAKTNFTISDFFEDDVIALILCDQIINTIPDFSINDYLQDFFCYGFYRYKGDRNIWSYNSYDYIENNYNKNLKNVKTKNGIFILRGKPISGGIDDKAYFHKLFDQYLLTKYENETKFLILYQVFEILIAKILLHELSIKLCANLTNLDSEKIKKLLQEQIKEATRINALINNYCTIENIVKQNLKHSLYQLLQDLGDPEYQTPYLSTTYECPEIFYHYRNKIVHNHRLFRENDSIIHLTEKDMYYINEKIEVMVAQISTTFKFR